MEQAKAQTAIVVEDDPLIAMMIVSEIQDLGWSVQGTAQNESAALELLKARTPDLALLDVKLGASNSMAIATFCKQIGIPILFLTGYVASDLPPECIDAPVLAKPFSSSDLRISIGRALAHTG
ncbi:response regulator [Pelagibacterium sp. H642]|uniref:response regulator n=1 Tax=Pelagibacterium sp. H642 TaxID=1881069 RepID=UPI002814D408|nr:response regulator [Pelagibacterium sp. H642]WMT92563.1 response regulator [Pelagibacterium sp. H642]